MADITGIAQVHISVRDLGAMVAFYRDVLGLPVAIDAGSMVFLDCGGTRLYLAAPEDESSRSNPLLYFRVHDAAALVRDLGRRGVAVRSHPHVIHRDEALEYVLAFIEDVEGNTVGLMEERPLAS